MKSILFNTEMVRAILDGRKTVTRRCIKHKIDVYEENGNTYVNDNRYMFDFNLNAYIDSHAKYKKGDILYVKETWKIDSLSANLKNMLIDFKAIKTGYSHAEVSIDFSQTRFDKFKKFYQKNGWQSPCTMPKEAARLFLRVTGVRLERLHDIKGYETFWEGIDSGICKSQCHNDYHCYINIANNRCSAIDAYKEFWNTNIKQS